MPVERRRPGGHTGRAVIVAVVGVALALGAAFGVATLANRGDVEVRLGDDRFEVGDAENMLDDIRDHDEPVLFPDPARGIRPIYLDNAGDHPEVGWIAVGAFLPDDPSCLVLWKADRDLYVAECDESITFPRSGAGLRQFATRVVDGRLEINLQEQE